MVALLVYHDWTIWVFLSKLKFKPFHTRHDALRYHAMKMLTDNIFASTLRSTFLYCSGIFPLSCYSCDFREGNDCSPKEKIRLCDKWWKLNLFQVHFIALHHIVSYRLSYPLLEDLSYFNTIITLYCIVSSVVRKCLYGMHWSDHY